MASLALDDALGALTQAYGGSIDGWRWGRAHVAAHRHRAFGENPFLGALLNIRQETGGGDQTILRGLTAESGPAPFANVAAGGYRAIYDFADLDRSVFSMANGQSGHFLSRHYDDFAEIWRSGDYVQMSLIREDAEAGSVGVLRLRPEGALAQSAARRPGRGPGRRPDNRPGFGLGRRPGGGAAVGHARFSFRPSSAAERADGASRRLAGVAFRASWPRRPDPRRTGASWDRTGGAADAAWARPGRAGCMTRPIWIFSPAAGGIGGAAGFEGEAIPTVWPSRRMPRAVAPKHIEGEIGYYALAAETSISEGSWEAAQAAADVALSAAADLNAGARAAFALCRPPGHHAAADMFGGYCFLNNAAIAAQALRDAGAERVAALDVDFHHGNGTQSIFYERDDVLFLSLHGDPSEAFPHFLGGAEEIGAGAGEGFTVNYPLPRGTGFEVWRAALGQALAHVLKFGAEALVVSLGVDTYKGDPISFFTLQSEDFLTLGADLAAAGPPTLFVMEGGLRGGGAGRERRQCVGRLRAGLRPPGRGHGLSIGRLSARDRRLAAPSAARPRTRPSPSPARS